MTSLENINNRKTQIIATIGPASETEETIVNLLDAGVDIFRFSYGRDSAVDNRKRINLLRKVSTKTGRSPMIMMDLPGRKNRVVSKNTFWVKPGDRYNIVWSRNKVDQQNSDIQILYPIPRDMLDPGTIVFIGDGDISAHCVSDARKQSVIVEFDTFGEVALGRGVTFYKKGYKHKNALTIRDKQIMKTQLGLCFDLIALSFVTSEDDILELRRLYKTKDNLPKIIAKIETEQAVSNIKEIIAVSDGIMIARGDLALNIPYETLPFIQKQIIKTSLSMKKPAIVATQLLESISGVQIPNRSEITDIATAVYQGASALMLSGETRTGKNPVYAVDVLDKVIRQAEIDREKDNLLPKFSPGS